MNPQTNQKTTKKSTKNQPKWLQNRSCRRSWASLGSSWELGAVLMPSWDGLGASWGRLWALLGASWGRLGAILGRLGPSWGPLGASWRPLGASWRPRPNKSEGAPSFGGSGPQVPRVLGASCCDFLAILLPVIFSSFFSMPFLMPLGSIYPPNLPPKVHQNPLKNDA